MKCFLKKYLDYLHNTALHGLWYQNIKKTQNIKDRKRDKGYSEETTNVPGIWDEGVIVTENVI